MRHESPPLFDDYESPPSLFVQMNLLATLGIGVTPP
jgi:hypothetical protein